MQISLQASQPVVPVSSSSSSTECEPKSKTRSVLAGREVPAEKQVLVGVVCFVSFQDQLCWVRKRKAKKIKLGDEWSMACYELCTHTNPRGGLAVLFLRKVELPKHSNEILCTGGSWQTMGRWRRDEGPNQRAWAPRG